MPKRKGRSSNPKVFISHSHKDRHAATDLQRVLNKHGAETFLDQERIEAGDPLPDRIRNGIKRCDTFLLIWSKSAAQSEWVDREWDIAYELRKKIVPYVLDGTPLPSDLDNLVYINTKDRSLGNAELLKTVFGKEFEPDDPATLFPGLWHARMDAFGVVQATYDLELRRNGQLEGEGGASQTGVAAGLAAQMGMGGLFSMRLPVHGDWSYDPGAKVLTLNLTASGFGQVNQDTVRVRATGREKGAVQGRDLAGRTWVLQRRSRSPSPMQAAGVYQLGGTNDDVYVVCKVCGARVKERNLDHHMTKVHSQ